MAATESEMRELQDLLKNFHTALLTTRGADGHFHSRPMALQRRSIEQGIWFATWEDTAKVADIENDPHCGVTLFSGEYGSTYVSISGTARIVRDREMIHRMWDPSWKPWFPDGPDQGDLVLIRLEPEHAEYVHPATGRLKVLFTMVKRLVTHSREEPAPKRQVEFSN